MRRTLFLALAALMLSCRASAPSDEPIAGPRLATTFPTYGQAGEVTLELTNHGPGMVGYNLCDSQVERLAGDEWVRQHPVAEVCTRELRTLAPGDTATFTFRLDADIPAGHYRVRTRTEQMDSGERAPLVSNTFAVTPRGRSDARLPSTGEATVRGAA